MQQYYSNGKLLLTGEYVVLDGALSLALPTKFGQSLKVSKLSEPKLKWNSFDHKKAIWLDHEFAIIDGRLPSLQTNNALINRLLDILKAAQSLNPGFLKFEKGFAIETHIDFDRTWGLGTSSTLINNIANWLNIDPYLLLEKTFGGSGYDIACASSDSPITYQIYNGMREVTNVGFNPPFKEHLYFVYLNKKKNSRDAIAQYKANQPISNDTISEISTITNACIATESLEAFKSYIKAHEDLISRIIKQVTIQEEMFSDFNGQTKSLGGWGGDFIMAISDSNPTEYFKSKGFSTILAYSEIIL